MPIIFLEIHLLLVFLYLLLFSDVYYAFNFIDRLIIVFPVFVVRIYCFYYFAINCL